MEAGEASIMNFPASVFVALIVIMGFTLPLRGEEPSRYASKVTYAKDQALVFPDFTLTYLGSRQIKPPAGLHGWLIHDFTIRHGQQEQKVSWSSGTGDIGPTEFQVAGTHFLLELSRSDTLGSLKENQLVIRRRGGNR